MGRREVKMDHREDKMGHKEVKMGLKGDHREVKLHKGDHREVKIKAPQKDNYKQDHLHQEGEEVEVEAVRKEGEEAVHQEGVETVLQEGVEDLPRKVPG